MNLPYSDVAWSQLEASEGNAHDIPALLREVEYASVSQKGEASNYVLLVR